MVTSRQMKEKVRDYRRSVKHSWNLFRESRIGMVGLFIMVVFIVMALISPYLGLRHPLNWLAPDDDILVIDSYFNGNNGVDTEGPFVHGANYRLRPGSGNTRQCDRIYTVGGEGTLFKPYSLYAYDNNAGSVIWNFRTGSEVTTDLIVNNYGSETNPADANLRLMFGCDDGSLYVLRDDYVETSSSFAPAGSNIWSYRLDSNVVGVSFHDERGGRPGWMDYVPNGKLWHFNNMDTFFASTSSGMLYAFEGPTPDYNAATNLFNATQPSLIWSVQVSNVSLNAPAVSSDGQKVFVSSVDGLVYGFDALTGISLPEWVSGPYRVTDGYLSTSPIYSGATIYISNNEGFIHAIYGTNGTAVTGWTHTDEHENLVPGFKVENFNRDPDNGNLTDITTVGDYILVGSDTGLMYSINRNTVNLSMVFNTKIGTENTEIHVKPYFDAMAAKYLFVTSTNLNGTATDPSDDFTVVFCIASPGNDTVKWRKTLDGVITSPIISFVNNNHVGSPADVVMTTVTFSPDGIPASGKMYSFSAAGRVITPLPPTWVTPSATGTTYLLGTDAQGHDILAQTILGSRIALLVGFLSAFFSIFIGVIFGLVSGYYGGAIDAILMRFTDVILVIPSLPLLITLAAILNPSIWNIILIISLVGWGGVARIIRAEVLSLKERPFIDAARVTGASKFRIMFKHIAPNVLPLGLLYMTFAVSGAILFEAALSFIGLGDPSTMTWGMMLNYVQHSNALTNWWWLLPPGICITLVCMSFFLLGRAFDEIVNPRLRRRR